MGSAFTSQGCYYREREVIWLSILVGPCAISRSLSTERIFQTHGMDLPRSLPVAVVLFYSGNQPTNIYSDDTVHTVRIDM